MKSESETTRGRTSGRSRGSAFQRNGERADDRYGRYGGEPRTAGAPGGYERPAPGPADDPYADARAGDPYGDARAGGLGDPYGERTTGVRGGTTAGTSGGRPGDPSGGRASGRYGRRAADSSGHRTGGAYDATPGGAGGRDATGAYDRRAAEPYGHGATTAFGRDETARYGDAAMPEETGPYGRQSDRYGRQTGPQATRTMPRAAAGATATMTAPQPTRTMPKAPPGARGDGRVPADDGSGNGLLVLILFWAALVGSVALWWFDTPGGSIHGTAAILTAAGRITGMAAGFALIIQVLMMSRVAWLESWVGAHNLLRWHRSMGPYVLIMVLVHIACIVVGYAGTDHVSVFHETWTMLTTFDDIVSAAVATGILVAIAFLAIRAVRRALPYELWYFLHLATYVIVLLAYGHQFADGQELSKGGVAQWYWVGLYALTVACLIWGRVVEPLWLNLRHRLRVAEVIPESSDTFSVYITGRRLDALDARAGQFFRWRFLAGSCWWQSHPFSLSAAPNPRFLRLTIGAVGDHTRGLRRLRPGTRVFVEGPSGTFTADRRTKPGALLIAGGSGIAPIRALMEDMPAGTLLIYRASTAEDLVLRTELEALAWQRGMGIQYVLGSRHDNGPRRLFTPSGLRELVPDVARRDVYLCGPPGLVTAAVTTLHRLKVPERQIHLDPFEF